MMWPLCMCQVVNGWERTISSWTQVSVVLWWCWSLMLDINTDQSTLWEGGNCSGAPHTCLLGTPETIGNIPVNNHNSPCVCPFAVPITWLAHKTVQAQHDTCLHGSIGSKYQRHREKTDKQHELERIDIDTEFVQMMRWIMKLVMEISLPQRMRRFSRLLPHQHREKEEDPVSSIQLLTQRNLVSKRKIITQNFKAQLWLKQENSLIEETNTMWG